MTKNETCFIKIVIETICVATVKTGEAWSRDVPLLFCLYFVFGTGLMAAANKFKK
jgi:hypothetical protein